MEQPLRIFERQDFTPAGRQRRLFEKHRLGLLAQPLPGNQWLTRCGGGGGL
ncbi:MAG: hypothetical protein IPJ27_21960 [Candidatus Accumulibacter sp.]|uniref:Uncharacterized protein n=1 Tax=Candidatus Accumulibacter proximus TaxID=2954385 RepID=A0A935Q1A7_9PROT|nr:hypothetical protein [Candidatus Accumulibacter proximus]